GFHLPPRRLVADADVRVHDEPRTAAHERAVVHDLVVQNERVRDHDLLVLPRTGVGGQQLDLGDLTDGIPNSNAVAYPERAAKRDTQARHEVADDGGGSEREHETHDDTDTLERLRAGAGDIRIRDHERHGDQREPDDPL